MFLVFSVQICHYLGQVHFRVFYPFWCYCNGLFAFSFLLGQFAVSVCTVVYILQLSPFLARGHQSHTVVTHRQKGCSGLRTEFKWWRVSSHPWAGHRLAGISGLGNLHQRHLRKKPICIWQSVKVKYHHSGQRMCFLCMNEKGWARFLFCLVSFANDFSHLDYKLEGLPLSWCSV